MAKPIFSRYLDTNGDGTGTKTANGNYAAAAEEFYIQPAEWQTLSLARLIVYAEDTGGMDNGSYGNGITLTNGIRVILTKDGVDTDLDGGLAIKSNGQWKRLCYDEHIDSAGSGNDSMAVRWTFTKAGQELKISGSDKLRVILNDDFTGLIDHTFLVQGYID